jgi:hypothetical protein
LAHGLWENNENNRWSELHRIFASSEVSSNREKDSYSSIPISLKASEAGIATGADTSDRSLDNVRKMFDAASKELNTQY